MEGKTFEDVTFELLSRVSPVKLKRSDIPFDSVRELVLNEISGRRQKIQQATGSPVATPSPGGEQPFGNEGSQLLRISSSSFLSNFLIEDEDSRMSTDLDSEDSFSRLSVDEDVRKSLTGLTSRSGTNGTEAKEANSGPKKVLSNRARRLAELRTARAQTYKTSHFKELNCEERDLPHHFESVYLQLLENNVCPVNIFYIILNTLDAFFRAKTWDHNRTKLSHEFLEKSVFLSCEELNEAHEVKELSDERRVKEVMIQILIGLHLYQWRSDEKYIGDVVNKLRIVYMASEPHKMKQFLEEPITDIFVNHIPQCLATIYDELCIVLPPDLAHYDTGFKVMDDAVLTVRRNGNAKQLEQLLEEAREDAGELPNSQSPPSRRRAVKRERATDNALSLREPESPNRRRNCAGITSRSVRIVHETPDEKLRNIKREVEDVEDFDEAVKQTPMAKLRTRSSTCSRRLSELVKVSEESATLPRSAALKAQKLLSSSENSTPSRTPRRTSRQLLFSNNTPSPAVVRKSSRIRNSTLSVTNRLSGDASETRCTRTRTVVKKEIIDDGYDVDCFVSPQKSSKARRNTDQGEDSNDDESDYFFTNQQIATYNKRMAEARARWSNNGQETTAGSSSMDAGTSASSDRVQRNRARRVIHPPHTVFMSHYLLNVSNNDPEKNFESNIETSEDMVPLLLHRVLRPKKNKFSAARARKSLDSFEGKRREIKCEIDDMEHSRETLTDEEESYDGDNPFEEEADD
ncbi:unnamed protein product [Caenorhabditis auriculariae]|uniref:Treslin STD domain-containing protein n=1 Tax=Caenorhabditis auriculariae TaxID=2777116 RepID=A0A8S1HIG8_9PELO|nr:unnamed protein product [Caenorhabditis auriculariae]